MRAPVLQGRADSLRDVDNAAEALVCVLVELGVDIIFLNPGTDTAPVQEALARLATDGHMVPRVVMCPHEAVALAAAHAYFAVTGRPQVVMVHVDVGTQNLGAMLHNASRAEAGVVLIAGRTPTTAYGEQLGGRDLVVHWHQDVPDQAGIVRSYVKMTGDLSSPDTLARQVARAFQVASSTPAGPVYLTVAREVLMQPLTGGLELESIRRFARPSPCAPDPVALAQAAQVLAHSERPVIITSRLGRQPAAVAELVRLAELIGAPVLDRRERVNFPSTHPLYVSDAAESAALLGDADAVLIVDSDVPWVPARVAPPESARIIQMDADPVKVSMPGWSFPIDICLQTNPLLGLSHLIEELTRLNERGSPSQGTDRRRCPRAVTDAAGTPERANVAGEPLAPEVVVEALDGVLRPDDIVVEEAVTNSEKLRKGLCRDLPGTHFQAGGSGLGWAVAAAVGVKLALPQRRVVAIVGDGTFLFSNPSVALWTALDAQAPVLVLVLANGGYAASRRPVLELFPDGASQQSGDVVGTRFHDAPDFAALAKACGAYGERICKPEEVEPALQRALAAVERGRSAVVVAQVSSPWL